MEGIPVQVILCFWIFGTAHSIGGASCIAVINSGTYLSMHQISCLSTGYSLILWYHFKRNLREALFPASLCSRD